MTKHRNRSLGERHSIESRQTPSNSTNPGADGLTENDEGDRSFNEDDRRFSDFVNFNSQFWFEMLQAYCPVCQEYGGPTERCCCDGCPNQGLRELLSVTDFDDGSIS
jgi:hypothetical protein